jgi:hypothetical protein
MKKSSIIAIVILAVIVVVLAIPNYTPKGTCEVARANNTCDSFKNVMYENCVWLRTQEPYNNSAPQIRWYIQNLCGLQNQYHGTSYNCSDIDSSSVSVCNVIVGERASETISNVTGIK